MLDECLASLAQQSFRNFTVLIYDNASTDSTGEIARRWCDNDPRFRYFRQDVNRGAKQNFLDVLAAAETPYFLWRAYDDLSGPEFLQELYSAITSRPGVRLAVPVVVSENLDGSKRRVRDLPPLGDEQSMAAIVRRLYGSHASWFYGLWDRETLNHTMDKTWGHYPSDWGSDHLALFPLLVDGTVAAAPGATFVQRIKRNVGSAKRNSTISAKEMLSLRRKFQEFCFAHVNARNDAPWKRFVLRRVAASYARKRIYPNLKLLKLAWRERRKTTAS